MGQNHEDDSAADAVRNSVGRAARPTKPMHTALVSDTTTHTVAIMRLFLMSSEWRALMKRTSTWGIPK